MRLLWMACSWAVWLTACSNPVGGADSQGLDAPASLPRDASTPPAEVRPRDDAAEDGKVDSSMGQADLDAAAPLSDAGSATPFVDDTWERAQLPPCPSLYPADQVPSLGFHAFLEQSKLVFRAGQVFAQTTWGRGVRAVFLRVEGGRLRYLGYSQAARAAGEREVSLDLDPVWLEGQVVYYVSYERLVPPMRAAVGDLLAWGDSALFKRDGSRCASTWTLEGERQAGWARLQHPQGAIGDHGVFTEHLDPVRNSASHFMNVPRFTVKVVQDQAGADLTFDVELVFAADSERPAGGKSSVIEVLDFSAIEGQEERAGAPPGSPRHIHSGVCTSRGVNAFTCNLGSALAYGQRVDWELRAVPAGTSNTNLYSPMIYYDVGHGFGHESADPRALGGGAETVDAFGANASERAVALSQHAATRDVAQVEAFVREHRDFRTPMGTALQVGRVHCASCHINDGRSDVAFEIPGVGKRLAPPLLGLGLLERVDLPGRVFFGWTGNRENVEAAVRTAIRADFGIETPNADSVLALTHYSSSVAVPQRDKSKLFEPDVIAGDALFSGAFQCATCHVETQRTRDGLVIRPYSDLKAHDLGAGPYRTAPLWGVGRAAEALAFSLDEVPPGEQEVRAALDPSRRVTRTLPETDVPFMHDGSARGLDAAIRAHQGESKASRAAYEAASDIQRVQLLAFLRTL